MAGELKDQRVVTMMTPGELEEIDDWMFSKRIRSRGEAIRRLCQMAIMMEVRVERLEGKARHIVIDQRMDAMDILGTAANSTGPVEETGPRVRNHFEATHAALLDISEDAIALGLIARGASEPGTVEDAIAQAFDALVAVDETAQQIRAGRELPYYGHYTSADPQKILTLKDGTPPSGGPKVILGPNRKLGSLPKRT